MSQRQSVPLGELRHGNQGQIDAVKELEQLFCLDKPTLLKVVDSFQRELVAGLADDRSSDLNMIPTYVTGYPTGDEKGTYLALEIAGMDIYACQVKLKGDSGKLAINQYQYKIPQDLASGDDFAVLIDYVVECISDFLMRVGTQDLFVYPMAVSFGFAIKQTRLDSGRILSLGYGLSYPNGVGVDIVELMHERIRLKGLPIKIVATANDSVCTLLAHAYQHPTTRLGIVHSLGTNCAYYEPVRNVTKLRDQSVTRNTDMIMNTEWCNFGSSRRTLPCTWFDRKLARESINPQFHVFEKMTTGIFLGELVRNILIYLVDRDILFGGESSETLNTAHSFDTSYMYVCEADDSETLEDTRIVLEDMLDLSKTTVGDREVVKKVCELIGTRAAVLVGASIAAIVQHMTAKGIGMTEEGYAISISGSIYEDYPSFHPRVCKTIKDLIPEQIAGKLSVGVVKHSRIVGAAIVAMMAEKIAATTASLQS
ncbi:hexokinase-domain-containing protein [Mucor lusitanicus]|uniref:Phosphotransferase n=1 Tax=Mucor circinelloides f. lusitanicus TaxID=29924 RepID=A0A8H4EWS0_MUCCL|nr:hexokinase-domain-containing protein [Mucor lusitanicus]